ncbi:hypothetical protein B5F76_05645 [Desulfovibrio sp. An276]|uniref:hypothetical protein n=1 Tax=Desulfovibrio sp. An276 TaxID=1965618 RepID=UPI000B37AC8F|nr:hypothetical protein [Desulfovibrio sp. An276]OUO53259.1 hypothetical protein B5F76_05645 [Desulfovibrio sp. An276]
MLIRKVAEDNKPGFFGRIKNRLGKYMPRPIADKYNAASQWLEKRNLKPGSLLLGPGLTAYFAGSELANGRSIGEVTAENAGFWAANKGFTRLMDRLPKFKGKSAVTAIGSFVAGIPASMAASSFAAKHMPIVRLTTPTMEQYGEQLMQKTSARIASKYTYRRY